MSCPHSDIETWTVTTAPIWGLPGPTDTTTAELDRLDAIGAPF